MSEPGTLVRLLSGRQIARNYHSYVITEVGLGIASGTVLREALKTLEAKGLVEARAKVGTRVSPRNWWNLYDGQVLAWILEAGRTPRFWPVLSNCATRLKCKLPRWPPRAAMLNRCGC